MPLTGLAPLPPPAARIVARRRFTILCVVYLLLILVDAGYFWATSIPDLAEARVDAVSALSAFSDVDAQAGDREALEHAVVTAGSNIRRGRFRLVGSLVAFLTVSFFLWFSVKRLGPNVRIAGVYSGLTLVVGIIMIAARLVAQPAVPESAGFGVLDLVILHAAACLLMPNTAKEITVPFALLFVVWFLTYLLPRGGAITDITITDRVVFAIISPLFFVPGTLIADWRWRRRQEDREREILAGRVESYGGELSRARIVHDAMFPDPFVGPIEFEYEYQPIHEIGGDYVHTHVDPKTGSTTLTLLDVAGHGLAAALTVNRLFGELERILAEHEDPGPDAIMGLLNRYINLTMSRHSMFVTGTCMRLDSATGELSWVNSGHPPSLVRRNDGTVEQLETTTMVLGVLESEAYDSSQRTTRLAPGETVIAYTDGAFEARAVGGERFGLERVRETAGFNPPPRHWPRFLANAVSKHHRGNAEDDVLIAALTLRSLRIGEPRRGTRRETEGAVEVN